MIVLTSSPTGPLDGSRKVKGLDPSNQFIDILKSYWKEPVRLLLIAADPDAYDENDEELSFFMNAFELSGLPTLKGDILDHRKKKVPLLQNYDVIILGGGHVPTQQRYFLSIGLKKKLQSYKGIIIGVSAGSMNMADTVYALPEYYEEYIDSDYQRYLPGLSLTSYSIVPHYQMIRYTKFQNETMEDIIKSDSINQPVYCLTDGSYILIDKDILLAGEIYLVKDKEITLINRNHELRHI